MPEGIGVLLCQVNPDWCAPPPSTPPIDPSDIAALVGKIRKAESEADALHSKAFHDACDLADLLIADNELDIALRLVWELQRIAPAASFEDIAALYRLEARILKQKQRPAAAAAAEHLTDALATAEKLRQQLVQARSGNP